MKRFKKYGRTVLVFGALLSTGLLVLFGGATQFAGRSPGHEAEAEKYLFVWAGDQARVNPDFLAVINFDEHSPDYGGVITTLPLSGPGATGNEPHHVGLSADGKILAAGGLLSFLKGQPRFSFSMSLIHQRPNSSPQRTRRMHPSPMSSHSCPAAAFWSR